MSCFSFYLFYVFSCKKSEEGEIDSAGGGRWSCVVGTSGRVEVAGKEVGR
jgi:hypothetical protein